ncbi:proton-translocating NADH-quinone oxidoreductase, chain L [Desulfosporosinus orientis DSM 765]|uniref:Proton-translocating NADH-quinone oxidoreductase, chain L n=1 Tax=Desulfosporosinus orientis (strain ATCC 19365 / DSM 765 / NCIMB 8382 / VKM B-1628 / Singapore I) TaxID=768706 RepID=G7WEA1_DESOD|nr:NADH-quinone oxidoreductase subunit L [Desulfosporosinus orientis]AET70077.1 proton-translocating NADH-quinone oxidoreductase, chain L [Desulfosporosinus orientis DSM 765]
MFKEMHDLFHWAWLVPFLPFLSFLLIAFVTKRSKGLSSTVSILAILASLGLAIAIGLGVIQAGGEIVEHPAIVNVNWLDIVGLKIDFGTIVDPLSAMMLFVVTLVASMVQIYSLGYMHGDEGFSRYYAYQSLFASSMLGMVIATNLLQLFIFWELVGLCSYLLIGFWFFKVSAREAAKKAFITTRVGDFGLLLGMLFIYAKFGTLDFAALSAAMSMNIQDVAVIGTAGYVTITAFLVFMGPIGKSGQFPLHVWLPDAMEGPTPVSALIHAATMVVAGVYLVARMYFFFDHASPMALQFIAGLGAFTAIFAASIAIAQDDIKRILAYSTLSQLGYMIFALGVGSLTSSMFHLMTHAFFKALMFLGAGSVIYAMHHKQDIWEMGGLWKKMPITGTTFAIGVLAISGVPPFAGFWSKDEILASALHNGHPIIYGVGLFTAFLTAFYMCRLFFVVFMGPERSENHAKESPWSMTIPLMILGFLSVFGGFVALPEHNFGFFIHYGEFEHEGIAWGLAGISVVAGLLGIALAYAIYVVKAISAEDMVARFPGVYKLLKNKYYIDEIYLWLIHYIMDGLGKVLYWFDIYIVDGIVNGLALITRGSGKVLRRTNTGQLQTYAMVFFFAVVIIFMVFVFGEGQLSALNPLATLGGVK